MPALLTKVDASGIEGTSTDPKTHELAASNEVNDPVARFDILGYRLVVDMRPAIDGGSLRDCKVVSLEREGEISPEPEY